LGCRTCSVGRYDRGNGRLCTAEQIAEKGQFVELGGLAFAATHDVADKTFYIWKDLKAALSCKRRRTGTHRCYYEDQFCSKFFGTA
jgi:hypothetical protein